MQVYWQPIEGGKYRVAASGTFQTNRERRRRAAHPEWLRVIGNEGVWCFNTLGIWELSGIFFLLWEKRDKMATTISTQRGQVCVDCSVFTLSPPTGSSIFLGKVQSTGQNNQYKHVVLQTNSEEELLLLRLLTVFSRVVSRKHNECVLNTCSNEPRRNMQFHKDYFGLRCYCIISVTVVN